MLACCLRVEGAGLLGIVPHHCLDLIVALLHPGLEAAPRGAAQGHGHLVALGDRRELLDILLRNIAHLPRPFGALGVGCVARGLVLALLLHLGPALHHVVLHVVLLLPSDALALILSPADLLPVTVAVLD